MLATTLLNCTAGQSWIGFMMGNELQLVLEAVVKQGDGGPLVLLAHISSSPTGCVVPLMAQRRPNCLPPGLTRYLSLTVILRWFKIGEVRQILLIYFSHTLDCVIRNTIYSDCTHATCTEPSSTAVEKAFVKNSWLQTFQCGMMKKMNLKEVSTHCRNYPGGGRRTWGLGILWGSDLFMEERNSHVEERCAKTP